MPPTSSEPLLLVQLPPLRLPLPQLGHLLILSRHSRAPMTREKALKVTLPLPNATRSDPLLLLDRQQRTLSTTRIATQACTSIPRPIKKNRPLAAVSLILPLRIPSSILRDLTMRLSRHTNFRPRNPMTHPRKMLRHPVGVSEV